MGGRGEGSGRVFFFCSGCCYVYWACWWMSIELLLLRMDDLGGIVFQWHRWVDTRAGLESTGALNTERSA